ncbi:MAG: hypothetical protein R8K46_08290 [Mariprofundaceae bacterium]
MMSQTKLLLWRMASSTTAVIFMLVALLATHGAVAYAASDSLSEAAKLKLGERMYMEGILPSGKPMQALVKGDIRVKGKAFACVNCHLRSGFGSYEDNIATPAVIGRLLYQPREKYIKGRERVPAYHRYAGYFEPRPAFTDETLANAITKGVDPSERQLVGVMPRYEIGDEDMAVLIAYLKTLSDEFPSGVTEKEIKFATIIAEGAPKKDVDSMLLSLDFHVQRKNLLAKTYNKNKKIARTAYTMMGPDIAKVYFSLARWILKGPSSTWEKQLEKYYQKDPVFAILGGITDGDWEPVHRFSENNHVPTIFPLVDYPVISDADWYTLYFSHGVRQEGEAAARYLNGLSDLFSGRPVVQIIRDSRKGQALAAGFRETWKDSGQPPAIDIILKNGESLSSKKLRNIVAGKKAAALLIWDDENSIEIAKSIYAEKDHPGIIIASGTYLGDALWTIPEAMRDSLYMTYPYRLPQNELLFDPIVKLILVNRSVEDYNLNTLRKAHVIGDITDQALIKMRGEFYQDYLLDSIGMMADSAYPMYERLSFGQNQRFASKGCYIVRLGKGESPQLEAQSEWFAQ